ncbi:MAG: WYL domain-containing protein [Leptospirales bacterium]|nr:WYL domain-containing protein [Leptospirales bacterium]
MSADARLRRLLRLPAFICARQGMTLAELAAQADYPNEATLKRDLDQLMMFGAPPFSPADFVTVSIEDDRVFLDFPMGLDRPLSLTAHEWAAVQRRLGRELEFRTAGDPVSDHLRRLLGQIDRIPVSIEPADAYAGKRALIQEALDDGLQLEFLYRTLSSREAELRRIDPWALLRRGAADYLIGWCHARKEARSFHLDRIDDPGILEAPLVSRAPDDLMRIVQQSPIFQPAGSIRVRIAFRDVLRQALEMQTPLSDVRPIDADEFHLLTSNTGNTTPSLPENSASDQAPLSTWLSAETTCAEAIWFRTMLRGFGPGIAILSPKSLRATFLAELQTMPTPAPL